MHRYLSFLLLMTLLPSMVIHAQKSISDYDHYRLSGFDVLIEKSAFIYDKALTGKAIQLLKQKLREIANLKIAQTKIDTLKMVPIFMDWKTTTGGAQYHPGKAWLKRNGYLVEKAQCVEISNISHFVKWSAQNQPEMVLHELAHAYHQRISESLKSLISEAYQNAAESNLYAYVQYHRGKGKHETADWAYAMNNEQEYFAELTEAYFGVNDYFPFDRQDLKKYDPSGYKMMVAIWGKVGD